MIISIIIRPIHINQPRNLFRVTISTCTNTNQNLSTELSIDLLSGSSNKAQFLSYHALEQSCIKDSL